MYSMDFEEFLWAKGYKESQIEDLYEHMRTLTPFSNTELSVMFNNFKEYMVIGGMPAIVNTFVKNNNYSGTLKLQRQILQDYEEVVVEDAFPPIIDKATFEEVQNIIENKRKIITYDNNNLCIIEK